MSCWFEYLTGKELVWISSRRMLYAHVSIWINPGTSERMIGHAVTVFYSSREHKPNMKLTYLKAREC